MPNVTLLTYKSFTLTHLSPQCLVVASQRVLKAIFANTVLKKTTGGSLGWNIVKILGKTSAKAKILNFTFSSKVKNFPSAHSAGAV
jgi:hypothetical protein